jgi:hypothetical protein
VATPSRPVSPSTQWVPCDTQAAWLGLMCRFPADGAPNPGVRATARPCTPGNRRRSRPIAHAFGGRRKPEQRGPTQRKPVPGAEVLHRPGVVAHEPALAVCPTRSGESNRTVPRKPHRTGSHQRKLAPHQTGASETREQEQLHSARPAPSPYRNARQPGRTDLPHAISSTGLLAAEFFSAWRLRRNA